jgi:hypothetical protein
MADPAPTALEICLSALMPIGIVLSMRLPPALANFRALAGRIKRSRESNARG